MLLLLLPVNYCCPLQFTFANVNINCDSKETAHLSVSIYIYIHIRISIFNYIYLGGGVCVCLCFAALPCEWLDTDWSFISPSHLSTLSSPLAALRTAFLKPTNASCSICTKPLLPALKEPPWLQWRLNPLTDLLSLSALSPLLLIIHLSAFYSLFLYPSLPWSLFCLLFSTLTSCFLSSFLPHVFPPLYITTNFPLSTHTPEPECAAPVQTGVCRAEGFFVFNCVCVEQGGGRGDDTQEHLTNISSRYVET